MATFVKTLIVTSVLFDNGLEYVVGQDDNMDDGFVSSIEHNENGVFIIFDGKEGYGRWYDHDGNEISEDQYFGG